MQKTQETFYLDVDLVNRGQVINAVYQPSRGIRKCVNHRFCPQFMQNRDTGGQ